MTEIWKTLEEQKVYENDWIEVQENKIINPQGGKGIYGVVHFKNLAIAVVPIDENGYTWIVGQNRYTLHEYSWEIPMGGGKIGQSPLASAKRELQEETGLTAKTWYNIAKIHTSNSVTDEVGYIFVAEDLTQGETNFDETEVLQIRKIHFSDLYQKAINGEITDALSLCAIFKLALIRPELLLTNRK